MLRDTFDYDISISIHALREEGDVPPRASFSSSFYFYPRPPRGGRLNPPTQEEKAHQFLSTPSARRATTRTTYADRAQMISIHALREEGDPTRPRSGSQVGHFYPRPPRGGRRFRPGSGTNSKKISIHALREEGDGRRWPRGAVRLISIHALREEGDAPSWTQRLSARRFLSTPSARRATMKNQNTDDIKLFLSTPSARRATIGQA